VNIPTRFTHAEAVDTWDAEFRWRSADRLHDVTIDDTWRRIAETAAAAEGIRAPMWTYPFVDSFRRWRLIPDERFLRRLGTDEPLSLLEEPAAVVNCAAFVLAPPLAPAHLDREQFVAAAALAVRFLDDAATAVEGGVHPPRLRIGIIGLADALDELGLAYASVEGRLEAVRIVCALAEGCVRGSLELAEDRGTASSPDERRVQAERLQHLSLPPGVIERVLASGLSHERLTAIDPHPVLARLANGVADGIDPLPAARGGPLSAASRADRREMRAALQPWIDVPIPAPPEGN
jgi:ribonucleoside-diphosphate reductase alpha chain